MPRTPRAVAAGLAHHVTQRGNGRRDVFLSDPLRRIYLELLLEHATRNRLRILGYCLMTNHLHLMVIPEESVSMANTFRHAHGRFAQYWNTEFRTSGHLWQNRYYSCAVEERAVGCVMAYVENNPVRAGMTRRAENYVWSSARAHLSGTDVSGCLDMNWWRTSGMQPGWSDVLLNAGMRAENFDAIRRATFAGRPLGSKEFVAGLERKLKRNLSAQPGGGPKHVRQDGGRQMGLWEGW
jgi:putative transposase